MWCLCRVKVSCWFMNRSRRWTLLSTWTTRFSTLTTPSTRLPLTTWSTCNPSRILKVDWQMWFFLAQFWSDYCLVPLSLQVHSETFGAVHFWRKHGNVFRLRPDRKWQNPCKQWLPAAHCSLSQKQCSSSLAFIFLSVWHIFSSDNGWWFCRKATGQR